MYKAILSALITASFVFTVSAQCANHKAEKSCSHGHAKCADKSARTATSEKKCPAMAGKTADTDVAKKKAAAVQTKCPVMGGEITDRTVATVWKGNKEYTAKKVYFCCPGCIETFNADPVKYIKKMEQDKQPVEDASTEASKS